MDVAGQSAQQTSGGRSLVVGCGVAGVTAAVVAISLLRRWWSKDEGVESSDSQQPSSDQQPTSSKSVQTEQSPVLEVEINEQKELNRQLMTRDRDMKQYIQLLQQELDKRFNEAVVHAARLREVESQLAEIQPLQSSETPTPQQLVDEPHYKRRIRDIYEELSEKLDGGKAARQLYQRGALIKKEFEEIQRLSGDLPSRAAEKLLSMVLSETEAFYEWFLDSLMKTDQLDVHQWIVLEGCDPDVECTAWIREHYVFLLDNLDSWDSGLVGYLYQFSVFDRAERDDVRTERTSAKQAERLLSILGRKSPEKMEQFYVALDWTGQTHIRRTISRNQTPDLDEQREQTFEEDHVARASKPGTDELQQKNEILVQRLAESSRREQDLTNRVCELEDSNDVLEQMKDKLEQKIQHFEEFLATDNAAMPTTESRTAGRESGAGDVDSCGTCSGLARYFSFLLV